MPEKSENMAPNQVYWNWYHSCIQEVKDKCMRKDGSCNATAVRNKMKAAWGKMGDAEKEV